MDLSEYKKKIQEVLQVPLTTDSPETLFKEIATIESLSYLAVRLAANTEVEIAKLNDSLRKERAENIGKATGTQLEKNIQLEAASASTLNSIERCEAEMKYWRAIGKLIENKVSLAQSILANITSQVKAGLYVNNIK